MKFLKSKSFLICLGVVLAVVFATALMAAFGMTEPLRNGVKTIATPFTWCGARAADALDGFVSVFRDYDELEEENIRLRQELKELKENEKNTELLKEENAWLKEYLKIAADHPEFLLADARVIARESGNYTTVLTLDKGQVHGVKEKMPVITEEGVFGYVKEAGLNWCKVVSIVETASSVGAYTDRGGALGVVSGDADLREGGMCRMSYIEPTADIRVGDRVYTSGGSGSQYPSGLLIGEVVSIEADESHKLVATIRPAVDFAEVDAMTRAMVICGYAKEKTS